MSYRPPRWPTDFNIQIYTADGLQTVALRNVAESGVCITGVTGLVRDQQVRLIIAGRPIVATIRWTYKAAAGAQLWETLSEAEIALLRRAPYRSQHSGITRASSRSIHGFREL